MCPACRKFTPSTEPNCCHCKQSFGSELAWKVPLIIGICVLALIVSVLLQSLR